MSEPYTDCLDTLYFTLAQMPLSLDEPERALAYCRALDRAVLYTLFAIEKERSRRKRDYNSFVVEHQFRPTPMLHPATPPPRPVVSADDLAI